MPTDTSNLRWVVRYVNGKGRAQQKAFRTEAARSRWLDKNAVIILSFSDPQ